MVQAQITRAGARASGRGPLAPLAVGWQHRRLIIRLARREIESRYRGSVLGFLWLILAPLLMLTIYTFIFSVVFQARWAVPSGGKGEFALLLFSGMIIFGMFSECVLRAPGLMLENVSYIKKVVFPLEIMPIVAMAAALFNAGASAVILLLFYLAVLGLPPATALLLPVLLIPLVLFTLGLTWFLASVGMFLRDLKQFIGILVNALLFLCPIFYPVAALPEDLRPYLYLNPLTVVLEQSKELLFWGTIPDVAVWAGYTLGAWAIAWLGHAWFMKTRKGFADVV